MPPLLERVAVFQFNPIAPEDFALRLEKWKTVVRGSYPKVETVSEWTVKVPTKNGVPDFTAVQPELSLRHQLWKMSDTSHKTWVIQCFPARVTFNVIRERNNPHTYTELRTEIATWLPVFGDVFKVSRFTATAIEYLNRLDATGTPQFVGPGPTGPIIRLGEALRIFSNIHLGKAQGMIVAPYDCKVTMQYGPPTPGQMSLTVKGVPRDLAITVSLRFTTTPSAPNTDFDCMTALERLDSSHLLLLEAFRNVFTDAALKSFGMVQP